MTQNKEGNIYFAARNKTRMTQQQWSELLGVSTEAVKQYEAGKIMPADDIVLRMADLSGLPILGTLHLRQKSAVAAEILPPVKRLPLAQAVVQLLNRMKEFDRKHHGDALLSIAEDGRVAPEEQQRFDQIVADLRPLIQAALQIDFAEK